ncbi:MAG: hypothetical protein RIS26_1074 [Actinomycetota bacterium]|jgi:hypothetical protein
MGKIKFLAVTLAALLLLTGCESADFEFKRNAETATRVINDLMSHDLPGYTIDGAYGGDWGFDYKNPDMYYTASKDSNGPLIEECRSVVDYLLELMPDLSFYNPSKVSIGTNKGSALLACVSWLQNMTDAPDATTVTSDFLEFWGHSDGTSVSATVSRSTKLPVSEGSIYKYEVQVSTNTGEADIEMYPPAGANDPVAEARTYALDLIGRYRFNHPNADPYSKSNIEEALAPLANKYPQVEVTLFTDAKGRYSRIFFNHTSTETNLLPACVSIVKFDQNYFGVEDPHSGYSLSYLAYDEDLPESSQFGTASSNSCPIY